MEKRRQHRLRCNSCGKEWTTPKSLTKAEVYERMALLTSCPNYCSAPQGMQEIVSIVNVKE